MDKNYIVTKAVEADSDFYREWDTHQSDPKLYAERSNLHQAEVFQAVNHNLLNENAHVIDIFNFDKFHARLAELTTAFHESFFTHALAIKCQSISGILCYANRNFGDNGPNKCKVGIEGASINEVIHGLNAGFNPRSIIFDSPVKTPADLELAIAKNFHINLDNFDDMQVVANILPKYPETRSTFGIRINPLAGEGAIAALSTAGIGSKFGLIYNDQTFEELFGYYQKFEFLTGVHCHVGSQGCGLQMLSRGASIVTELAERLNKNLGRDQVKIIDIGGGIPTNYKGVEEAFKFQEYRDLLEKECPNLFSGKFQIITEFGRCIMTKCGVTITKIFSIKESDPNGSPIDRLRFEHKINATLFSHVGANVFYREVYQHLSFRRRFTIYDKNGVQKDITAKGTQRYDIAGPLCFQGDYLCKEVILPKVYKGDLLVMHDTGGYAMSLYSKYNSLQSHDCYGYSEQDGFKLMKAKQTREECLEFWGPYE